MAAQNDNGPRQLSLLLAGEAGDVRSVQQRLSSTRYTRFEIETAPSLPLAVETLRRKAFDVLLLALRLPDEAEFETLFRAQMHAHRIPIVVLSSDDSESIALRAVEAGIQEFLVQGPAALEGLERTLRHAVVRHRILSGLRHSHLVSTSSLYDAQTGLMTQAAFLRRLQESVKLANRFGERPALLILELDRFRKVSGHLSPVVGTRLLDEIGRRLTWCIRRSDLAGRLGDDRFGVLLPNVPGTWAVRAVAERLRQAVAAPFESDPAKPRFSASIGTACYPQEGDSAEAMLQHAEEAMAEAKGLGGNRCRLFKTLAVPAWPTTGGDLLPRSRS
ncbi:MAG TPA: GGDEF domain-containing response regulator [Thermoanaerobaculia bacterium]|nr:GGDEF domain-containing response regulator [Thermoanaerobaculia bacterium]